MTFRARSIVLGLALLGGIGWLSACDGHDQPENGVEEIWDWGEDSRPEQAPYPGVVDQELVLRLQLPDLFPDLSANVHYPMGISEGADAFVRIWATDRLAKSVGRFLDSFDAPEDPKRLYPMVVTYTMAQTPGAVGVRFRSWTNWGGAHDNWSNHVFTFDRQSGKQIELEDLFPHGNSLSNVVAWLNEHPDQWTNESRQDWWGAPQISPEDVVMERTILTSEGITLIFDPYEKGSFSMGNVEARIPREEFDTLGIKDRYWHPF